MAKNSKRVLVVDDSAFMRRLISEIVGSRRGFTVVGNASNGVEAIARVRELDPDIVTLDIAMPRMDGFEALSFLMRRHPRPIIVLSAADSTEGNSAAIRALELGAVEFVRKPSGPVSVDLSVVREQLGRALDAAALADVSAAVATPGPAQMVVARRHVPSPESPASQVVVVGASTGGPRALSEMLAALPSELAAAVLIVQHIPPDFVPVLVERLGEICPLPVLVGKDGMLIRSRHVYVAPGGSHMVVRRAADGAQIGSEHGDPICGACPAADPLFMTAASVFREAVVGVVLTGMGRDGAAGLAAVRAMGGGAIVQDRSSSIIYGMPRAALAAAGADRIAAPSVAAVLLRDVLRTRRRVA